MSDAIFENLRMLIKKITTKLFAKICAFLVHSYFLFFLLNSIFYPEEESFSETTSKLEDHMNGATSFEIVALDGKFIGELLTSKNQSNLFNVNTLFLL